MALFDFSNFNTGPSGLLGPNGFDLSGLLGGGTAGLLGNLPMWQQQMPQGAGFPGGPAQPATDVSAAGMQQAPQAQQGPMPQQQQMPQQMQQAPASSNPLGGSPDFGDRLSAGFQGFTHAPSLMAALGNLVGGLTTGQRSDPQGMQQQTQTATYQALRRAGVPDGMAGAAALNPDVLKVIAPEYFGGYKVVQTGENPLGKQFQLQGPGGTFRPIPDTGGNGTGGNMNLLAPGVSQMNSSLTGDAYLQQFGPEVQAAVKAYINGDVMPTGNPRQQGITTLAKTIAQKYGMDTGVPVNDETYARKRKMQTELAGSSPNTMGGVLSNGKSAFEHLATLSDNFANLGNASGPNIPLGGHMGTVANAVTNVVLPSPDTKGKLASVRDNAQKYGAESTKFYSATGGGEGERMAALRDVGGSTVTAAEQAAYLETEKQLMLGRLKQKEAQIRDTMGADYLERHPVVTPDLEATVKKIDDNIKKLRGETTAATAAAPGGVTEGATATNPQTGAKIVFKGGQWVPAQ